MRVYLAAILTIGLIGCANVCTGQQLVVLQDTGRVENGLPVVAAHPDAPRIQNVLSHGFAARLVRLDHMVQVYLHAQEKGPQPEPAYLVFTRKQGGFARQGFVFNGQPHPRVRWVDLPATHRLTGVWGGVDQIFPHELAHVIMARLADNEPLRVPVQTHAVGVRTSPSLAFQEGFAEHEQIMAVDDPGADAATRALTKDSYWSDRAARNLAAYRRELQSRFSLGARMRVTFPFWFGSDEQVLRYYAVKTNAYARRPSVPRRLIDTRDYRAYLLDRILPGAPQDSPRSAAQLVATEGVVSHVFWLWVNSPEIGRTWREPSFYTRFGVDRQQLDPLDNAYLKIFFVVEESQAGDLPSLLRAYQARFPDESRGVDALVKKAFLGQDLPSAPNLWILNRDLQVGTTLFDQWRSTPQPHCFDLNAADSFDLRSLGLSAPLVQAIQDGTPYNSFDELSRVPGMTQPVWARLRSMEYVPSLDSSERDASGFMRQLLLSYFWRALVVWVVATTLGASALRLVEPWPIGRALGRGALASGVALLILWMGPVGIAGGIWLAVALLAVPAALWRLRARVAARVPVRPTLGFLSSPVRGILVWAVAVMPAWLLTLI